MHKHGFAKCKIDEMLADEELPSDERAVLERVRAGKRYANGDAWKLISVNMPDTYHTRKFTKAELARLAQTSFAISTVDGVVGKRYSELTFDEREKYGLNR
jgi:hypothetical protein